jgi:hypothetical protein
MKEAKNIQRKRHQTDIKNLRITYKFQYLLVGILNVQRLFSF